MKKTMSLLLALIMVFSLAALPGMSAQAKAGLLSDGAGLLSYNEKDYLKTLQKTLSDEMQFDIAIVTKKSIGKKTPEAYSEAYFKKNGFGRGKNGDGCLLLIDMGTRHWNIYYHGYAMTAFNEYGRGYIKKKFLSSLSAGDYYGAFYKYTMVVKEFVTHAKTVKPYSEKHKAKYAPKVVRPDAVRLRQTEIVYDGKAKKPSVVVCDESGEPVDSETYTLTYDEGRKDVGKYGVTVTFTESGEEQKLYFKILPNGTSVSGFDRSTKALTVKWKKRTAQTEGYELQMATNKAFTAGKRVITVEDAAVTETKVKSLKRGKTYYFRIRTYQSVKGKKYYSKWSKVKAFTPK